MYGIVIITLFVFIIYLSSMSGGGGSKEVIDLVSEDEDDPTCEKVQEHVNSGTTSSSSFMDRWLYQRNTSALSSSSSSCCCDSRDGGSSSTGREKPSLWSSGCKRQHVSTENNALRKLIPSDGVKKARREQRIPEVRPPLTSASLCYKERVLPRGLCLQEGEARPSRITSSESVARQRTDAEYPPLARGMLLWREYLSPEFQQELLQTFDEVHSQTPAFIPKIYIYDKPCFQNVYSLRYVPRMLLFALHMQFKIVLFCSVGSSWQAGRKQYADGRSEFDGRFIQSAE